MTDERTVLDRALNGRDMAEIALMSPGFTLALEDYETGLVDALANLMHYARRYRIDFNAALESAHMHHNAEKAYSWDEIPR